MNNVEDATKVSIALTNPKSATNVGAVMRAAGCYQADKVIYSGTRYDKALKFQTDTKSVSLKIPLQHVDDFFEDLAADTQVICVELVEGATPLPDFVHPEKALYIFGPEDGTISQAVLNKANSVVYVPTIGCMNLAASVNVVLYDRLAKLRNLEFSDNLIKESRDRNNNVTLKTT